MHINIDTYIQDYHESGSLHGLHRVDGRVKIALLVTAVALNIYFARIWLSLSLFSIGTLLVLYSRIPLRLFLIFFLIPAWSTLIVVVGFTIGFGTTPLAHIGPVIFYREGFDLGLAAAARVACDMAWMAAIFLTTPFNTLLNTLKWFKVPELLLDTVAMGYRYISLIFQEFIRMKNSAMTRGGYQKYRLAVESTARILAQVVLRAYDRATRIQEAMTSRGANARMTDEIGSKPPSQAEEYCPNRCDITPDYNSPDTPVLACNELTHKYGAVTILENISLSIKKMKSLFFAVLMAPVKRPFSNYSVVSPRRPKVKFTWKGTCWIKK